MFSRGHWKIVGAATSQVDELEKPACGKASDVRVPKTRGYHPRFDCSAQHRTTEMTLIMIGLA